MIYKNIGSWGITVVEPTLKNMGIIASLHIFKTLSILFDLKKYRIMELSFKSLKLALSSLIFLSSLV